MSRILIIDDEADICRLLSAFLMQNGYEVEYALAGQKGLASLFSQNIDLVLCDFRIGDMDGLQVYQKIKKSHPELPVIIMTAYSDIKTAVYLIKEGVNNYITKPINLNELLEIVNQALAEHEGGSPVRPDGMEPDIRQISLEAEQAVILRVLKKVNFNRSEAARILKIDRKTLYNKLKGLDLKNLE